MNHETNDLRQELRRWLRLRAPERVCQFEASKTEIEPAFERSTIAYGAADGDVIRALLLTPRRLQRPAAAIVVHHQHNGERHFGKSEVCGLVGNPLQGFGPALAENGIIVLAPDSICFEDRRINATGTVPHPEDWQQHYNEMAFRLLRGDTLMRKVLEDAETAVSVLRGIETVDSQRIGILGHSYGGNTVMFQAALDERVRYACTSGAVCSFRNKMAHGTGIEMAEVLPGVIDHCDVDDLLRLTAPRPLLVVSAEDDRYSQDADQMVEQASDAYAKDGTSAALVHHRYSGGHEMTEERFNQIILWLAAVSVG